MIFDQISNWKLYKFGPAWEKAFNFLVTLTPDTEEGEYPIDGTDIFARVMSYDTIPVEEAKLEAHMQYVDIQTTLSGEEAMGWFPTLVPDIKTPYSDDDDVIFFEPSPDAPGKLIINPDLFVALFPDDAHMPQLKIDDKTENIKKVVIKIRYDLLK